MPIGLSLIFQPETRKAGLAYSDCICVRCHRLCSILEASLVDSFLGYDIVGSLGNTDSFGSKSHSSQGQSKLPASNCTWPTPYWIET